MLVPRLSFFRPSIFSLLVCSALASKLLTLYQYIGLVNGFLLFLFFPTFFIFEFSLFVVVWFALLKTSGILYAVTSSIIGFLTYVDDLSYYLSLYFRVLVPWTRLLIFHL